MDGFSPQNGFFGLSGLGPASSGPTPAELEAALFEGQDGILLHVHDRTALFLTDLGATNVSVDTDSIGFAGDKHLAPALTFSANIDAQPLLVADENLASIATWSKLNDWDLGTPGQASVASASANSDLFPPENGGNNSFDGTVPSFLRIEVAYSGLSGSVFVYPLNGSPTAISAGAGTFLQTRASVAATLLLRAVTGASATITRFTLRGIPGNHLTQSGATQRPRYYTTGLIRFDAFDDRLAGAFAPGASGNTIGLKIVVPETVAATQIFAGCQTDSSTRFYIGVNTSGQICAGVGTDGITTIVGSADERGNTIRVFLRENGTTVDLIVNGVTVYSEAQNGSVTTTVPFMVGALNNNGTAASFTGMDLVEGFVVNKAATDEEIAGFDQIWS